jgi:hypothetical protein
MEFFVFRTYFMTHRHNTFALYASISLENTQATTPNRANRKWWTFITNMHQYNIKII